MTLFDTIRGEGHSSISIIGLAKNVGKTTTLNYLIEEAAREGGITLGITSTGWDGEAYDSITGAPKPRIMVHKGCIVATTRACLARSELTFRILEETAMMTSLGEVVIIEAQDSGRVEVAGPVTISELGQVKRKMNERGCSLIIFDGALNRKASASPEICDAITLATGMNAGYHLDDVKRHTSFWLSCFSLQKCTQPLPEQGRETLLIDGKGSVRQRMQPGSVALSEQVMDDTSLLVPGALTDAFVEDLLKLKWVLPIIIEDSTKIFLSPPVAGRWKKRGGQIILRKSTKVTAITVNPTSVSGKACDADFFLRAMAEICAPYPTWDIVTGKGMNLAYDRETEASEKEN